MSPFSKLLRWFCRVLSDSVWLRDLPKLSSVSTGYRSFYSLPSFVLSSTRRFDLTHLIFHNLLPLKLAIRRLEKWIRWPCRVGIDCVDSIDLPKLTSFVNEIQSLRQLRELTLSGSFMFLLFSRSPNHLVYDIGWVTHQSAEFEFDE